jgi:hypothetical protein
MIGLTAYAAPESSIFLGEFLAHGLRLVVGTGALRACV